MHVAIVRHGVDNVGTRGLEGGRHGGVADCCWLAPLEAQLEVVIAPCRKSGRQMSARVRQGLQ